MFRNLHSTNRSLSSVELAVREKNLRHEKFRSRDGIFATSHL